MNVIILIFSVIGLVGGMLMLIDCLDKRAENIRDIEWEKRKEQSNKKSEERKEQIEEKLNPVLDSLIMKAKQNIWVNSNCIALNKKTKDYHYKTIRGHSCNQIDIDAFEITVNEITVNSENTMKDIISNMSMNKDEQIIEMLNEDNFIPTIKNENMLSNIKKAVSKLKRKNIHAIFYHSHIEKLSKIDGFEKKCFIVLNSSENSFDCAGIKWIYKQGKVDEKQPIYIYDKNAINFINIKLKRIKHIAVNRIMFGISLECNVIIASKSIVRIY